MVVLALGFYGFATDIRWNEFVDKRGINVCVDINQKIYQKNESILIESECQQKLRITNLRKCRKEINWGYLIQSNNWTEVKRSKGTTDYINNYIETKMKRQHFTEMGFLLIIIVVWIALIFHLIMTSISKNVELRTKWNAALQGIVMFASGYSAVLLAISTNQIDANYDDLASRLYPCGLVRFCDREVSAKQLDLGDDVASSDAEFAIAAALTDFQACQEVGLKKSICVLLILLIVTCAAMILLAMELTTKYEQETDEELEALDRQLGNKIEALIEDQQLNFDIRVSVDNVVDSIAIPLLPVDRLAAAQDFPDTVDDFLK